MIKHRIYPNRICECCNVSFTPKTSNTICCQTCIPTPKSFARYRFYGISQPQYDNLLRTQNNSCAICFMSFINVNSKRIHVDHDHETGFIRGILCQKCNHKMAIVDNAKWLQDAMKYKQTRIWSESTVFSAREEAERVAKK